MQILEALLTRGVPKVCAASGRGALRENMIAAARRRAGRGGAQRSGTRSMASLRTNADSLAVDLSGVAKERERKGRELARLEVIH